MTAKEYLSQYRDADRAINDKLEEITRLRELACKTTQSLTPDKVQTSTANKTEIIVSKIVDLEAEVDTEIDRLQGVRREVLHTIGSVPDSAQRAVLRKRYISGKRWEEVAVELHYDYRWVLRLHGRALQHVEEAIKSHILPVI